MSFNRELDLIQRQLEANFADRIAATEGELQRLQLERADALESLARLRRALSSNGLQAIDQLQLTSFRTKPAKTLTEAIKHVIRDFIADEFDINTVIGLVTRHHPEIKQPINPTSVSGSLRALWREGILAQARGGAGPKPAIYKLTELGRADLSIVNEFKLELEN